MTETRAALASLADCSRRLEHLLAQRLRVQPIIGDVVAELEDPGNVRPPVAISIEEVADQLRCMDALKQWAELPRTVRRYAPWALWTGTPAPITCPAVLDRCIEDARQASGTYAIRALIALYIQQFDLARPRIVELGSAIIGLLQERDNAELEAWKSRHDRFAVFDAQQGPGRVAATLLSAIDLPAMLRETGLDGSALELGFAAAVYDVFASGLRTRLPQERDGALLPRLAPFLEHDQRLRFRGREPELAVHLLEPWLRGKTPAPDLRETILGYLIRHYGDPRSERTRGTWVRVPPEHQELARRWLARVTLEEFFELISDRTDSAQWSYRRAFWSAVARTGLVSNAWLVLNSAGQRAVRRRGDEFAVGRLLRRGATDQSVLLLQVGTLVFSEISHNGKLHAWRLGDSAAPVLGLETYDWSQVYRDALDFPDAPMRGCLWHTSPASGLWQRRAAKLIENYTGVRLNDYDWQRRP